MLPELHFHLFIEPLAGESQLILRGTRLDIGLSCTQGNPFAREGCYVYPSLDFTSADGDFSPLTALFCNTDPVPVGDPCDDLSIGRTCPQS